MLTDEQWSTLQPLFAPPSPFLRGRPPLDDRLILDAIIYKISTGIPWSELPPEFPSHQTVYRRFQKWQHLGLWSQIFRTLWADMANRGDFDLPAALYSGVYHVHHRVHKFDLSIDPSAPETWQIATGYFLLREYVRQLEPEFKVKLESKVLGHSMPRPR